MFIDIHILQSVPPSNINRDDTGSPKTAIFGGTRRARVSSQAWKRATRKHFNENLDDSGVGYRTRKVAEVLGRRIAARRDGIDDAAARELASKVFTAAGIKMVAPKVAKGAPKKADESGYLLFLSATQLDSLVELALASLDGDGELDKKRVKAIINSDNSIDVALFGRMIADDAELNVDAAVQVAHAISVQAVEQEFDYFTAVDDFDESEHETGAGMIGTIEFNSSTLYRYATINVKGLEDNLGDASAAARAAGTFLESFVRSMPTGKQNTFANRTLPEVVVVAIRDDQPVNLVGAFEQAVSPTVDRGAVSLASEKLVRREAEIAAAYGPARVTFRAGIADADAGAASLGESVALSDLVARVEGAVLDELSASA
ncbi:type I-E CRISPR-associated protein Cas7/Cse4/CasC [Gordonia sp. NPDC003585]|uniref:type I-E CRISPR-associated protein Cas7/Cse4/CasC n=1 Tax=Gordonia sp. NPDC003585 TaxID=3154275 RepID=UPI0033A4CACC